MIKKLKAKKIFAILGLASLLFGFFNFIHAESVPVRENYFDSGVQTIQIVVTEAPARVNRLSFFESAASATAVCGFGFVKSNTLVQDQVLFNLNQPGECFDLSVGLLPQAQTSLSVMPLLRHRQKIVVLPAVAISGEYYHTVPVYPAQTPVVPTPQVLAVFFGVILGFKAFNLIKLSFGRVKQTLTLHQLQVMRC